MSLPYVIVVKFHILHVGPMTPEQNSIVRKMIVTYVADAESIFSSNGVGVLIGVNQQIDAQLDQTKVQEAIDLVPDVAYGDGDAALLLSKLEALSSNGYAKGEINVYVFDGNQVSSTVATANTYRAFFAESPLAGNDYIVINQAAANNQSFAHEIGHALSLDHVNDYDANDQMYCKAYNPAGDDGLCDYTTNNLMWIDGPAAVDRNYLTPPQVFRAVLNKSSDPTHKTSFINRTERIGRKPQTTFDCPGE